MRALRSGSLALACLVAVPAARAQNIRPPVGGGAIEAARKNVEKTNEQTRAAEKADAKATQQQKAAPPQQKAAPAAQQQKTTSPAQKAPQKADQKSAAAPNQKAGTPQKAGGKAGSKADTSSGAVSQAGGRRNQVQIFREQFAYGDGGRRDPFVSLMLSGELRPVITDLSITGVLWDSDPRKSLALLVDGSTGESYRVRVGQPLGRMRVTRIGREDITFSFDEFGLSRTETLTIDRTKTAGPAPARRP
jgi:hypothetical protein